MKPTQESFLKAIEENDIAALKMLLDKNILDIYPMLSIDNSGLEITKIIQKHPFYRACQLGYADVAMTLIDAPPFIHDDIFQESLQDSKKLTPEEKKQIRHHIVMIRAKNYNKGSLLEQAVKDNDNEGVRYLIEDYHADYNQPFNTESKVTPLITAIMQQNVELVMYLLRLPKIKVNYNKFIYEGEELSVWERINLS